MRRVVQAVALGLLLAGCASPQAELETAVADLTDAANSRNPAEVLAQANQVITLAEQQRDRLGTQRADRIVELAEAVGERAELLRAVEVPTPTSVPTTEAPEPEPEEPEQEEPEQEEPEPEEPEPEPEPVETQEPEPEPTREPVETEEPAPEPTEAPETTVPEVEVTAPPAAAESTPASSQVAPAAARTSPPSTTGGEAADGEPTGKPRKTKEARA